MNEYTKLFENIESSIALRLQLFKLGERIPKEDIEKRKKVFEAYKEVAHKVSNAEIDRSLAELKI